MKASYLQVFSTLFWQTICRTYFNVHSKVGFIVEIIKGRGQLVPPNVPPCPPF